MSSTSSGPRCWQHCVFKYNGLVLDPDDGGIESFEDFVADREKNEKLVATSVRLFDTKEAALAYKQGQKKRRQAEEQQQRKRRA